MNIERKVKIFDLFWENSKINRFNIKEFGEQLSEYGRYKELSPQLFYPQEDIKLTKPKDKLANIFTSRKSTRNFTNQPLSAKYLNGIFQACTQLEDYRRVVPSAGARYPVEVYAISYNVKNVDQAVYYYNPDRHSLSFVAKLGTWEETQYVYNLAVEGMPALMLIFVGFSERVTKKYGERGGRFLLLEAGHYAQNIGLRLAFDHLGGVEVGGIMDDEMKKIIGLEKTEAKILLGFAIGVKESK